MGDLITHLVGCHSRIVSEAETVRTIPTLSLKVVEQAVSNEHKSGGSRASIPIALFYLRFLDKMDMSVFWNNDEDCHFKWCLFLNLSVALNFMKAFSNPFLALVIFCRKQFFSRWSLISHGLQWRRTMLLDPTNCQPRFLSSFRQGRQNFLSGRLSFWWAEVCFRPVRNGQRKAASEPSFIDHF